MHPASPGRSHKPCRGMPWTKADESMFGAFRLSTSRLIDDDFWVRKISATGPPAQRRESQRPASGENGLSASRRRGVRQLGVITSKTPQREPARAYPRPLLTA